MTLEAFQAWRVEKLREITKKRPFERLIDPARDKHVFSVNLGQRHLCKGEFKVRTFVYLDLFSM